MYHYHTYGLTLASRIELPELPSAPPGAANVLIRYGDVPPSLAQPTSNGVCYQLDAEHCLLDLHTLIGVRYLVRAGQEIIVERTATATAGDVRLFLLGSCMGALLYQRQQLPLHGSAIQTPQGSLIFVGVSGSGKSTLAAALGQRGYRFLADDVSVIDFDAAGQPVIYPGYPQVRLWADAAAALGQSITSACAVRLDLEKYALPAESWLAWSSAQPSPPPVAAIYILQASNCPHPYLEKLHGMAKVTALQEHAYRDRFAIEMGKQPWLFGQIAALTRQVAVRRVYRPKQGFQLAALMALVEQDLGLAPGNDAS